jgi:hypothetical protein
MTSLPPNAIAASIWGVSNTRLLQTGAVEVVPRAGPARGGFAATHHREVIAAFRLPPQEKRITLGRQAKDGKGQRLRPHCARAMLVRKR